MFATKFKKAVFIQPRQTGKTTNALELFLSDFDNSLFVSPFRRNIPSKFKGTQFFEPGRISGRMMDQDQFKNHLLLNYLGAQLPLFNTVIFDEFFFGNDIEELYRIFKAERNPENVFVFSSMNRFYDKQVLSDVRELREEKVERGMMKDWYFDKYQKHVTIEILSEMQNLFDSFLTDPEYTVYQTEILFGNEVANSYEKNFGKRNFDLEIKNKWIQ